MSASKLRQTRSDKLAALGTRPGNVARAWDTMHRPDVLLRIAISAVSIGLLWVLTSGWQQPFSFRIGEVRPRDVVARVKFSIVDDERTAKVREQRIRETPCFYRHDPQLLIDLRESLKAKFAELSQFDSFDKVPAELKIELFPADIGAEQNSDTVFTTLQRVFVENDGVARLEKVMVKLFADWERNGILDRLDERHTPEKGSQTEIRVYPEGKLDLTSRVEIEAVRQSRILSTLERRLMDEWREAKLPEDAMMKVVRWLSDIIRVRLRPTLNYDDAASVRAREEAEAKVVADPEMNIYEPGKSILARGGRPLDGKELMLLRHEYEAIRAQAPTSQRVLHSLATLGMYVAMYVLCGFYIAHREPRILTNQRRFITLLGAIIATVTVACWFAIDNWRAEMVPIILFGMTITITYRQELALMLSAALALVVSLILGFGLAHFVVCAASTAAAILLLGRIRSRTRLIHIGGLVGVVSFMTSIGVCTLVGQAFGSPAILGGSASLSQDVPYSQFVTSLFAGAAWEAACSIMAGLLMTALLPFIERLFDVQTDIKLLELGDAAHALLQELVRRAPGTYNHSINVASIGEAAAESIHANGLLVRVGAYFHDIGKMLKPNYFIENQGQDVSRHLSLVPAMSTLVIIAHVKDGANLARQHGLPQSIIDFIEQHHGTTLVEYFYRQATRQSEADPDGHEVDEASFRYPGPKPQTREAAVLMMADAVEGASRALVDPTPARIENLVHEITMKRLLDGQFEECSLTLQELHIIEESLVKSLTAVYHGRVKYPDQQSA